MEKVKLKQVDEPEKDCSGSPVALTDKTINERKHKVLQAMKWRDLDQLIIYGDVEHGSNFEYLTGYFTRFEEGLLIINRDGDMTLVLGNENLNKASKSRCEANCVHVSLFSLPNQPNRADKTLKELLVEAGIRKNTRIGLAGWKLFTSTVENNKRCFDLPVYIVDTIRDIVGDNKLITNETDLFIGENGVRTINNANEIAHYEYGASLASDCMLDAMNMLDEGVSELELGDKLVRYGQHTSIVTIAAGGPRYIRGNMFPTDNRIKKGDTVSLTVGYRGGSSSRAGYAVGKEDELPEDVRDYISVIAAPYFAAYAKWLESISIGMKGKELFSVIDEVLPRSVFGWHLCPGHLTAEEEWLSSPVYENSAEEIKSGMIFQIDIIPSVQGYGGVSAESTVALAGGDLKKDIKEQYPEMWDRMMTRRKYLRNVLGIAVSEDILPMCSTVGYLRPFLLDKRRAFVKDH